MARRSTDPPPVSPWLGLSGCVLGTAVVLAASGACEVVGLGAAERGGPAAFGSLAVGLVLVALALRANAWVVGREVARWRRRPVPPRPRLLPLLAGTTLTLVLAESWSSPPAVAAAGLVTVVLAGALTRAGRRAQGTTLAVYVAWSVLGAGFGGLPLL